jgi:hypothetical protein
MHVSNFLAFSHRFVCLHKNTLRLKLKTTSQQETQPWDTICMYFLAIQKAEYNPKVFSTGRINW